MNKVSFGQMFKQFRMRAGMYRLTDVAEDLAGGDYHRGEFVFPLAKEQAASQRPQFSPRTFKHFCAARRH